MDYRGSSLECIYVPDKNTRKAIEDCIKTRRSVRRFLDKEVSKEELLAIVEAGNWAPSAGNLQSRFFLVVQSKSNKEQIYKSLFSKAISRVEKREFMNASAFIVVCADIENCRKNYGERALLYSIQDASASVQNMLLSVHARGLGGLWFGQFDHEKVKKLLPEDRVLFPVAIIALGYPAEIPLNPGRKNMNEVFAFDIENPKKKVLSLKA